MTRKGEEYMVGCTSEMHVGGHGEREAYISAENGHPPPTRDKTLLVTQNSIKTD